MWCEAGRLGEYGRNRIGGLREVFSTQNSFCPLHLQTFKEYEGDVMGMAAAGRTF